jgi:hypothetical protein
MPPTIAWSRNSTTITPKTRHALSRTSSRLRRSESVIPARSMTTAGATSARKVRAISPGTMIRMNPMKMMIDARIPAPISVQITGETDENRLPTV